MKSCTKQDTDKDMIFFLSLPLLIPEICFYPLMSLNNRICFDCWEVKEISGAWEQVRCFMGMPAADRLSWKPATCLCMRTRWVLARIPLINCLWIPGYGVNDTFPGSTRHWSQKYQNGLRQVYQKHRTVQTYVHQKQASYAWQENCHNLLEFFHSNCGITVTLNIHLEIEVLKSLFFNELH